MVVVSEDVPGPWPGVNDLGDAGDPPYVALFVRVLDDRYLLAFLVRRLGCFAHPRRGARAAERARALA